MKEAGIQYWMLVQHTASQIYAAQGVGEVVKPVERKSCEWLGSKILIEHRSG